MRLRGELALLALAVCVLSACGDKGGHEGTASATADETAIRATIEQFYDDLQNGEGDAACGALTPEAADLLRRDTVETAIYLGQIQPSEGDGLDCTEAVARGYEAGGKSLTIRFGSVSVDGDTASVVLESKRDGPPGRVKLTRDGEDWLIAELPSPRPGAG